MEDTYERVDELDSKFRIVFRVKTTECVNDKGSNLSKFGFEILC